MGRNLVVCCDGTGNFWGPSAKTTNVVRLVKALVHDEARQIYYYDPGVGTPDGTLSEGGSNFGLRDILRRVGGLAWGDGVWSNVAQAYEFLAREYAPGDRIFLFGFSRGAFTARAVGGLIHLCGLLRPDHVNMIPSILRIYRSADGEQRNRAGAEIQRVFSRPGVEVHFTGVWDTVESVGMFSLLFGASITSNRSVKATYRHVRHAVALDEQRAPYTPRLYERPTEPLGEDRSFKQVGFCGAHSDVGGSYAEDGLSNAALHWMAREANAVGLIVNPDELETHAVNALGLRHDEPTRFPAWVLAGIFRRDLRDLTAVHETVKQRIDKDGRYRTPIARDLPVEKTAASVMHPDGRVEGRPVPTRTEPAQPMDLPVSPLLWFWFGAALLATAVCWTSWSHDLCDVTKIQVWRGWEGLFHLGDALAAKCGSAAACPGQALRRDAVLLASYASLLPVALLLLLRVGSHHGSVSPIIGRAARAGAVLPFADLAENVFTAQAWAARGGDASSFVPTACVEGLYSLLTTAASLVKFGALGVLGFVLVACVLSGVTKRGR